jgi:hypothetical protein
MMGSLRLQFIEAKTREREYLGHGGILPFVLRRLLDR